MFGKKPHQNNSIIMIMIIIMIALKSEIRKFHNLLTAPARMLRWPGRNRVQITCNISSAYHVQHVVCHLVRSGS